LGYILQNAAKFHADLDPGIPGWGTRTIVWAYTGSRDKASATLDRMSTIQYVSSEFPVTFISGGNDDPLTDHQSVPLASKLESPGVHVETLFYAEDHEPGLEHEYQFTLDNSDGQQALAQMLAFMKQHSAP
jgi:acetyl esterase/lipase